MIEINLVLTREFRNDYSCLGRLTLGDQLLGYTCEDTDRQLELYPERKQKGITAIPRGRYRLTATLSSRFGRVMPLLVGVKNYDGVRIHGGNSASQTEGCPLLGKNRTAQGVSDCKDVNIALLKLITDTEAAGNQCWIEIK